MRVVTGTGDLRAENLRGAAELRAGTGDLHTVGVSGPLRLSTQTGDVHVETPSANIVARTSRGDVHVREPAGRARSTRRPTRATVGISVAGVTYAVRRADGHGRRATSTWTPTTPRARTIDDRIGRPATCTCTPTVS